MSFKELGIWLLWVQVLDLIVTRQKVGEDTVHGDTTDIAVSSKVISVNNIWSENGEKIKNDS